MHNLHDDFAEFRPDKEYSKKKRRERKMEGPLLFLMAIIANPIVGIMFFLALLSFFIPHIEGAYQAYNNLRTQMIVGGYVAEGNYEGIKNGEKVCFSIDRDDYDKDTHTYVLQLKKEDGSEEPYYLYFARDAVRFSSFSSGDLSKSKNLLKRDADNNYILSDPWDIGTSFSFQKV